MRGGLLCAEEVGEDGKRVGGARGSDERTRRRLRDWDPVGEHEVAQILGVIQQQVARYERDRAEGRRDDFPAPVKRLARGPLWDRTDIEEFDRTRRRRGGPEPGTTARGPRALAGLSEVELAAVVEADETGLSERERRVLGMRLGMSLGARPGEGDRHEMPSTQLFGQPLGQQAVAEKLGKSLPAVKKAQQRAVEKVLAVLRGT